MITATRYHDFSYGHRVAGHENKCAQLHGHNGRVHFTVVGSRDAVGRVLDFGRMKALCQWVEDAWDHRFLVYEHDPYMKSLVDLVGPGNSQKTRCGGDEIKMLHDSLVWLPFNPTAENMADYLLREVGPLVLPTDVTLVRVQVDETRKCSAAAELDPPDALSPAERQAISLMIPLGG